MRSGPPSRSDRSPLNWVWGAELQRGEVLSTGREIPAKKLAMGNGRHLEEGLCDQISARKCSATGRFKHTVARGNQVSKIRGKQTILQHTK